jgi:hypothetical protein
VIVLPEWREGVSGESFRTGLIAENVIRRMNQSKQAAIEA